MSWVRMLCPKCALFTCVLYVRPYTQVRSRFAGEDDTPGPSSTSSAHKAKELDPFFKCLARLGFTVQSLDTSSNTMFFVAVLRKLNVPSGDPDRIAWPALKACVYKKR